VLLGLLMSLVLNETVLTATWSPPDIAGSQAKGRFKFERIGAPQPGEMARIAAKRAVEMLQEVDPTVVPFFR
jgi:hypothetical protein